MADLGTAYVNIVPKAEGISNKMEGLLSGGGAGEKAGKSIGKKIISGIAALGIGAAVGKMIKSAFDAGGALEQSFGGLDTIYGEASDAAKEFSMNAAQMGISANTYAEQAVGMGAALKAAFSGDTAAAAAAANMAISDMADNAAKMGSPLESLQNAYAGFAKANYTMLDNLKLGYGGTKEEMQRLLSDAQKISGVKYDLSNLGDVYEAIHVIQGELGLTGVAAAEGSTTLTGSMAAVKASWENTMAALTTGEGLDTAMTNLTTSVGSFADNVLRMLTELGPQLPGLILGLADVIVQNAPAFLASGLELILQVAVGLIEGIPDLVAKVPEIFAGLKGAFSGVDWASLGKQIINGIINGLTSAASALYSKMRSIIRSALSSANDEAEVGSPSRLFARELGHWIPPGIAMGIEDNVGVLNDTMRGLVDSSLLEMQRATTVPTTASDQSAALERGLGAIASRPVQVQVVLDANAKKMLRVIKTENYSETRRTSYNGLSGAMT